MRVSSAHFLIPSQCSQAITLEPPSIRDDARLRSTAAAQHTRMVHMSACRSLRNIGYYHSGVAKDGHYGSSREYRDERMWT
jgi:hypothetical protein